MNLMICCTDCSSEINFAVNSKAVDSGASLTVGDVLTCFAEGALSYRWSGLHSDGDLEIDGKTLIIPRPGSFNYECSVFVKCGRTFCPFTKNISGFARGRHIHCVLFYTKHYTL